MFAVNATPVRLLATRNLRRGRTQLMVVAVLSLVAGALLNLGALCGIHYPQMLRDEAARLHAPEVLLLTPTATGAEAADLLRADARVSQVDSSIVLSEKATFRVDRGTTQGDIVYIDLDRQTALGHTEIVERADASVPDPVYLPHLFRAAGNYRIGDPFTLTTATGVQRTFHVAGFVQNTYLGFITMGATGLGLSHEQYAALGSGATPPDRLALIQAKVPDSGDVTPLTADVTARLGATSDDGQVSWAWNWNVIQTAALTGPAMYAVSLVLFTLVVTIVVLMVIGFWIRGAIEQDLPTVGMLETFGFGTGQIVRALAVPAAAVVATGSLAGVLMSYAVVPFVANSLAGQTGMPWDPGFDPVACIVTVAFLTVVALGLALVAARRLRRLEPVVALRGGIPARSFARGWLPLSSSRGDLHLLLGLKQGLAHRVQTLLVAGVCLVVGLGSIFSASLFTNVLTDRDGFIRTLVGEYGEVAATVTPQADRAAVIDRVRAVPGVERAHFKDFLQGSAANLQSLVVVMEDFGSQDFSSVTVGREPRHANEIAVGALLAEQSGKRIGEQIEVRVGEVTQEFMIVGTLSTVQYGGMRVDLTREGYTRLVPDYRLSGIDIAVAPGAEPADVIAALTARLGSQLKNVTDQQESIDSQFGVYLAMMRILAWGILAVTAAVTALVIALVVSTVLARERSSFGVRRAVGFTGRQLVRQLVAAYLPAVVLGTIVGCMSGLLVVPRVLAAFLAAVGVDRASLATSPGIVAAIGGGLVALAATMIVLGAGPLLRRGPLVLMARS